MHVSTYFQAVHPIPNVLCMVPQSILQDSERYPKYTIFSQFPLSFFTCVNQAVCWSKCTARYIMTLYFKKLPWDFVRVAGHAYQKVYPTFALLLFYYYYYYKDNRILNYTSCYMCVEFFVTDWSKFMSMNHSECTLAY